MKPFTHIYSAANGITVYELSRSFSIYNAVGERIVDIAKNQYVSNEYRISLAKALADRLAEFGRTCS